VGYATGQTDEWRGTGVWSGLSLTRESDKNKKDNTNDEDGKNTQATITKSTDMTVDSPNEVRKKKG
jgi:t-SNARE complex subunit (syntaxin)